MTSKLRSQLAGESEPAPASRVISRPVGTMVSPGGNELLNPPVHEFNSWNYTQIYRGDNEYISPNQGGVVPNVNDKVTQYLVDSKYLTYRVTYVDPVTHLSTLDTISEVTGTTEQAVDERLFAGAGVGLIHGHDFIFVNNDTVRYPAEVNRTLRSYGNRTSYYKLYLGTNIDPTTATCISVHYNSKGEAESDQIPIEIVDKSKPTRLVFRPGPFNINRELPEGTIVTIVGYTGKGGPVSYQPLRIVEGNTIQDLNSYSNFITGIELVSPYISSTNKDQLIIPENFLHTSLLTQAKVNYASGESVTYNIGEHGVQLINWDDAVSGQYAGQERKVVLQYLLGVGETADLVHDGGAPHKSRVYTIKTSPAIAAQSVKLYVAPTWDKINNRYNLKYYLLNLDRTAFSDVTDSVKLSSTYNPTGYGLTQRLNMSVKMSDINPSWASRNYVQSADIELKSAPSVNKTPFELFYANVGSDSYGQSLQVIVDREVPTGQYFLKLDCELTQQADWLDKLYNRLMPQYDLTKESGVVIPSHVEVVCPAGSIKVPIEQWNRNITISFTPPTDGDTILLRWYKRDARGRELNLAVGSLIAFSLV